MEGFFETAGAKAFIEQAWMFGQILLVILATGILYKAFKWAERA